MRNSQSLHPAPIATESSPSPARCKVCGLPPTSREVARSAATPTRKPRATPRSSVCPVRRYVQERPTWSVLGRSSVSRICRRHTQLLAGLRPISVCEIACSHTLLTFKLHFHQLQRRRPPAPHQHQF